LGFGNWPVGCDIGISLDFRQKRMIHLLGNKIITQSFIITYSN